MLHLGSAASERITLAAYFASNPPGAVLLLILFAALLFAAIFLFAKYRSSKSHYIASLSEREQLIDMAQRDGLTGLYNAITCQTLISEQLSAVDSGYGTLLVIDIDYFKSINDTFGHLAGDQVLTQVSDIFRQVFSPEDIIGRRGGDEFMIYLRKIWEHDSVARICMQLGCAIKKSIVMQDGKPVSVSIGASITDGRKTFDTLYREADSALYTVKGRGRDGYQIVDVQAS
jgi:diguanylate cyclase (GGDEF)-like protein